ncbi:unnamed protein product [Calicophoron daubneyi]|uniref:Uncharacterized protein n=1 Tax=Calicophoron daubneyi TaxID=300641 RepID=A0AAV2TK39_CALDB
MEHCGAHKAFYSLWLVTDDVFKYIADIRAVLNDADIHLVRNLGPDPPSYETSVTEQLIERIKERLVLLESLNNKRRVLYNRFKDSGSVRHLVEDESMEEKKQTSHSLDVGVPKNSPTPRDIALKSLRSFVNSRDLALRRQLDLLKRTAERMSEFREGLAETGPKDGRPIHGCPQNLKLVFCHGVELSGKLNSLLLEDRTALLKDGKLLETEILKVPRVKRKEMIKMVKEVNDRCWRVKYSTMHNFADLISPILEEYLQIQTRTARFSCFRSGMLRTLC